MTFWQALFTALMASAFISIDRQDLDFLPGLIAKLAIALVWGLLWAIAS